MAVLFNAGDHVPVMLLVEVVGRGNKYAPAHFGATAVNVGVTIEFTLMLIVALFLQSAVLLTPVTV